MALRMLDVESDLKKLLLLIRVIVREQGMSLITIHEARELLEVADLIHTRPGKRFYVADHPTAAPYCRTVAITTGIRVAFVAVFAVILALLGSGVAQTAQAAVPPEHFDTAAVDSYVAHYLDRHGLVGAQIAVVHQGQVVHIAAYGESTNGKTTTDTPMAIGSVSKQITSFALLQLVEDDLIALDDPVIKHLPEFILADERVVDITLRHLLSHTSGLPSPVIVAPASNLHEGVQRLSQWELASDPGQQYRYSNMNYHVAARLIEHVTEMPFATYLKEHIFQPLGMHDTRTVNTTHADDPGLQDGHVTAYGVALSLREMEQLVAGAGGVVSTAEDLSQWLAMLTNNGTTPSGEQLLTPELLEQAQSAQPGTDGEGLGWHLSGEDVEPPRVGHSGAISRYSAQLEIVPESGYGVVVQLNSYTPSREHYYSISSGILDITEGATPVVGAPVPTFLDMGLGLMTVLVVILTVLGVRRSDRWAQRRSTWSAWRYGLRLLPQVIGPIVAVLLFVLLPTLNNNSLTTRDIFGFWPAVMIFLLALAVSGIVIIIARASPRIGIEATYHSGGTPKG